MLLRELFPAFNGLCKWLHCDMMGVIGSNAKERSQSGQPNVTIRT